MRERPAVDRIGLIAGHGRLPLEAARSLRRAGASVAAIALEGLADPRLADEVDGIAVHGAGQLEAAALSLRGFGVERVLLVGGVPKTQLFGAAGAAAPSLRLDETATRLLASLAGWDDASLFRALAGWLADAGFEVLRQDAALAGLAAEVGPLSARALTASEQADVDWGMSTLSRIAAAGIGQCLVVRHGCVVAVESIEGTDETIRRAGRLAGPGGVVVKAARADQDRRFDLPVVGSATIEAVCEAGARVLAVEAGTTLLLDREEMIRRADHAGIALVGVASAVAPTAARRAVRGLA